MPNIPNTTVPGLILTSLGRGDNSASWSTLAGVIDSFPYKSSWSVQGAQVVPSAGVGDLPPDILWVPAGAALTLVQLFAFIGSGTSVTVNFQINGLTVTGLSGISVLPYSSVAAMTYTPTNDVTINNGDRLAPVITAVSGSPIDLSLVACYLVN